MRLIREEIEDPRAAITGLLIATFIACDACGEKIIGQDVGIVVFEVDADGKDAGTFKTVHKKTCDTREMRLLRWQSLDVFLRDVVGNAGIDLAETERRISGPGGSSEFGLHF